MGWEGVGSVGLLATVNRSRTLGVLWSRARIWVRSADRPECRLIFPTRLCPFPFSLILVKGFFLVAQRVRLFFNLCAWEVCLHICLHTMCVLGAHRGHKTASDPRELELQTVVSPVWVLAIEHGPCARAARALNCSALSIHAHTRIPAELLLFRVFLSRQRNESRAGRFYVSHGLVPQVPLRASVSPDVSE